MRFGVTRCQLSEQLRTLRARIDETVPLLVPSQSWAVYYQLFE